ncbi:hypothetical protein GQ457_15G018950 [Hibiscus cannabinus]
METNLRGTGGFTCEPDNWKEFFTVSIWMLLKHKCSRLMDAKYIFKDHFRLCCQRRAVEYMAAFVGT